MAHEELQKQYAIDAEYSDKPWEKWEFFSGILNEWVTLESPPNWLKSYQYRRKPSPKTLTLTIENSDRWMVEPPIDAVVYYVNLAGEVVEPDYSLYCWQGGQLFKTKEAAQAFADALKIE